MEKLLKSNLKLGIITGGQLGKMIINEASKWSIISYVLDKDENCPSSGVASVVVQGSQLDFETVYQFGKMVDVLTYEIENINIDALVKLRDEGIKVLPSPEVLQLVQDKGLQKDFFLRNNILSSNYKLYQDKQGILNALLVNQLKYPFVQKLRKGGYDGRGVAVIEDKGDLGKLLEGASVVEKKVDIHKELSVILARNEQGEVKCFPVVEMVFDPNTNMVDLVICPSKITEQQAESAKSIASELIQKMDMVGLLAVEFFIDMDGKILVNEVAPRPHNSGHHTIEGVVTSQFEQQLRAILNLPLGSTQLLSPAVMLNLTGDKNFTGPVLYEGLAESMAIEGVNIHLYGKKITRPFRKMGHVTIISDSIIDAIKKAKKVKKIIKVKSWEKK